MECKALNWAELRSAQAGKQHLQAMKQPQAASAQCQLVCSSKGLFSHLWRAKRNRHASHCHMQCQPSMQQGLLVLKRCVAQVSQWAASEGRPRELQADGAGAS